jgi:hypothetical protein
MEQIARKNIQSRIPSYIKEQASSDVYDSREEVDGWILRLRFFSTPHLNGSRRLITKAKWKKIGNNRTKISHRCLVSLLM